MVVLERLRIVGGVSGLLVGGLGTVVAASRLSARQPRPSASAAEEGNVVAVVPAGRRSPGDRMEVSFEDGSRGVVIIPAGLSEGQRFIVRPPHRPKESSKLSVLRCGLIGLAVGSGIVLAPFVLYGGTSRAKVLAPICTLPVAATLVATGVYLGRLEQEQLAEQEAVQS
jgi:hypothetical protein